MFFFILHFMLFMHVNATWQSLCVCY